MTSIKNVKKHCLHLSFYLTNCRTVFFLQELNVEMRKSQEKSVIP